MKVANSIFEFLTSVFDGLYEFSSEIYEFLSNIVVVDGQEFTLFSALFGSGLIVLLLFFIVKGLIT